MLMFSLAVFFGLVFLVLSADRFIAGAAAIANNFGVPHIIIGVTIVSLGTSAPEIIAAIIAAIEGQAELAMGNAIGSNIANIGLVLGATAIVAPIPVSKRLITNENLVMLAVAILAGILLFNRHMGIADGAILIAALVLFLGWIYWKHQNHDDGSDADDDFEDEIPSDLSTAKALAWFAIGLLVLVASARVLLWGAMGIAVEFGISQAIIGATVIAIGTSLPELAASIASALKKHHDIAIGNVLGSNIFNILTVLAVPGFISPGVFSKEIFNFHYLFMLAISALLFVLLMIQGKRSAHLGRYIGIVFVVTYAAYIFLNYQAVVSA